MKKKIKSALHYLQTLRYFLQKNNYQGSNLSLLKELKMKWKGFYPDSYNLFNLKINDPKDYISDFKILQKCPFINGEFSNILNNKLTFAYFFRNENRIIKPRIYTRNNKCISFESGLELPNDAVLSLLEKGEFILKGAKGGGGNGIHLLQRENNYWLLNKNEHSNEELLKFIKSKNDLLVFDRILQTGFANELNSSSVNTIRIITMKDPHTNEVFAPFAGLRVGRKASFVDNCEHGGYAFLIDVNTGITGKAPILTEKDELVWEGKHPDSNDKIEGIKIPNWDYIKNEIIHLAQKNSFMPYIGWDVVTMETDFLIIEGNNHPGLYHYQAFSSIKKIEKVNNFYKYHGVI